jgi:hypothetical protein
LVLGALLVLTLFASVSAASDAERPPADRQVSAVVPADTAASTAASVPIQARAAAASSPSELSSQHDPAGTEQAADVVELPPPFAEV